uniref:Hexosyltransferase n=1 Tax=Romanomermis culicivorax TaxID=13658 RepID=A0A915JPW3_ROMCU
MIICFYNLIDYSIVYEKLIIANTINYSLISQNIINDDGEINFVRDNLDQIFNDTYAKCLKKSTNLNFTYQWKVKPKNCSSKINVVLMIKSSIYKGEMRRILRQRWARNVSISQYHIRRIFLIGSAPSDQKSVLLDHEIAIHDDILQGDFLDTYKGGTKKVLLGMRYVKLFCSSTRLIIFADDDAVISMWNFLQYFDDILGDRSATANLLKMIAGFEIRDSQPRRKKMVNLVFLAPADQFYSRKN